MSISLCMIARNEEEFIGNALKSAENFVDEIIVVDTGSTDKTIEIAKSFNAKVFKSTWKNDFSYHRNQAIKQATCDYVLILDCDEKLVHDNTDFIRELLESGIDDSLMGFNIPIVNIINNTEIASFQSLRFFRNHKDFYFKNPIHEQIILNITEKYSEESISELPLTIHHYGYDKDIINSKNKIKRNLDILNSIPNKDGYYYAMIGDEYLKCNDYKTASISYTKSFDLTKNLSVSYAPMMIVNYSSSLINLKNFNEAINVLSLAKQQLPNFKDLYFLEYWIFNINIDFKLALEKLDKYIEIMHCKSGYLEVKKYENIYDIPALRENLVQKFM